MARIRTVKPEFWTSEQIAECSPNARLLFIGIWNFCDDAGIHPASVKRLKMEVFPSDNFSTFEISEMVGELLKAGLMTSYQACDAQYWRVTGWHHQKIDQPTFKHPDESGKVPSSPAKRRVFGEHSASEQPGNDGRSPPEGKGMESKGVEEEYIPALPAPVGAVNQCSLTAVVDAYHQTLTNLPRVRMLDRKRQTALSNRQKEYPKARELDWWKAFFAAASESKFLMGESGDRTWRADFDFLISPKGFKGVIEGKYQ